MGMRRNARRHETIATVKQGARSEDWWEHKPGARVITVDGPGRVEAVYDGPHPGSESYEVTLEGGLGGGTYGAGQITAASPAQASVTHTADQDYPELGTLLHDRPDPAKLTYTASLEAQAVMSYEDGGTTEHAPRDVGDSPKGDKLADHLARDHNWPDHMLSDDDAENEEYHTEEHHEQPVSLGHYHGNDHGHVEPGDHYCEVHDEYHDDPEEASDHLHNGAHTDWSQHTWDIPDEIHRGMNVKLPQDVHDFVHNEDRPTHERVEKLLHHLKGGMGIGMHWSTEEDSAKSFAEPTHDKDGSTRVILTAQTPHPDDFETDPDKLDGAFHFTHEESEIPVKRGTPLKLTSLQWNDQPEINTRARDKYSPLDAVNHAGEWFHPYTHHDFEEPHTLPTQEPLFHVTSALGIEPNADQQEVGIIATEPGGTTQPDDGHDFSLASRRTAVEHYTDYDDPNKVYLRFGHWPKDERSQNNVTGHREEGVSVYELDSRGNPSDPDPHLSRGHHHDEYCEEDCDADEWNDEFSNDAREEMEDRKSRAEWNRRNGRDLAADTAHLVKGDLVGFGHDDEPLIQNVKRVGDWIDHRHHFIPGADKHRLARDEDDEDYEPPEEQPTHHTAHKVFGPDPRQPHEIAQHLVEHHGFSHDQLHGLDDPGQGDALQAAHEMDHDMEVGKVSGEFGAGEFADNAVEHSHGAMPFDGHDEFAARKHLIEDHGLSEAQLSDYEGQDYNDEHEEQHRPTEESGLQSPLRPHEHADRTYEPVEGDYVMANPGRGGRSELEGWGERATHLEPYVRGLVDQMMMNHPSKLSSLPSVHAHDWVGMADEDDEARRHLTEHHHVQPDYIYAPHTQHDRLHEELEEPEEYDPDLHGEYHEHHDVSRPWNPMPWEGKDRAGGGTYDDADRRALAPINTGTFSPVTHSLSMLVTAAMDPEFRFHVTAAWSDVRAKAKRIRSQGGVQITHASDAVIMGNVKGDHNVYETGLQRYPGKRQSVATYSCGCKWGAYHWGAPDDMSRFAGRMCSHALALQYEAASRGMFGRDVEVDDLKPKWVPSKVVVKYDIDSGQHLRAESSMKAPEQAPLLVAMAVMDDDDPAVQVITAAVNDLFGDTSGYQEPTLIQPQGPTSPWNVDENPGASGPLTASEPNNWGRINGPSMFPRIAHLLDKEAFWQALVPVIRAAAPKVLQTVAPAAIGHEVDKHQPQPVQETTVPTGTEYGSQATLHDDPEGALPSTDGEEHEASLGDVNLTGGGGIGSTMRPEDKYTASLGDVDIVEGTDIASADGDELSPDNLSIQPMGSAHEIVASFQRSAAAQKLMASGGQGSSDIAAAAEAFLAKTAKTTEFTRSEQEELIHESPGVQASNTDRLNLDGTHYAEIQRLEEERGDDDGWLF